MTMTSLCIPDEGHIKTSFVMKASFRWWNCLFFYKLRSPKNTLMSQRFVRRDESWIVTLLCLLISRLFCCNLFLLWSLSTTPQSLAAIKTRQAGPSNLITRQSLNDEELVSLSYFLNSGVARGVGAGGRLPPWTDKIGRNWENLQKQDKSAKIREIGKKRGKIEKKRGTLGSLPLRTGRAGYAPVWDTLYITSLCRRRVLKCFQKSVFHFITIFGFTKYKPTYIQISMIMPCIGLVNVLSRLQMFETFIR